MGYLEAVRGVLSLHAENRSNQNKLYIHRLGLASDTSALTVNGGLLGEGLAEPASKSKLATARKTKSSAGNIFKITRA